MRHGVIYFPLICCSFVKEIDNHSYQNKYDQRGFLQSNTSGNS